MNTIFIGIDPAFRKKGKGVCVIDGDNVSFVKTYSPVDFINFIFALKQKQAYNWTKVDTNNNIVFGVENSNMQKALFDKIGSRGTLIGKSKSVSKNQAISQLAVDLIKDKGFQVFEYSPKQKGSVISLNEFKLRLKANRQIFKVPGTGVSEDKRAAYMIAMLAKNRYSIENRIICM